MHIHHLIRGGLIVTGVGIGTICIAASAGAGSHGVVTASAGGHAAAAVAAPESDMQTEPLLAAPPATPVVIEVPEVRDAEAETAPDPAPYRPVVHAGPGPAVPVPGATTLIDPLVIERHAEDEA